MTETCSASSRPDAIRLRISCPDLAGYRASYLERHRTRGVLIPPGRTRSRPIGSGVLLKLELGDGTLAYSGPAVVRAHLKDGSQIGLVLELDRAGFADAEPRAPLPAAPAAAPAAASAQARGGPQPARPDPGAASAPPAARPPPLPARREVALRLRPTPPPLPHATPTPVPLAQAVATPRRAAPAPPPARGADRGAAGIAGSRAVTAALVAGAVGLVAGAVGVGLALGGDRQPVACPSPAAGGPGHDLVDSTQRAEEGRRRPGTRAADDGAPGHGTRREAR